MASSLRIACAGNNPNLRLKNLLCGGKAPPACSLAMPSKRRISAATRTGLDLYGAKDAVEGQERLDRWMRESVVEIVKSLREAPLLVQVHAGAPSLTTDKKVVVEDWEAVKERWESGDSPLPEGVIFVEELDGEAAEEDGGERTTKAWGIVVQGKGVGCGPVCYLLKTSRVGSGPGPGMGVCSTHFCLMKVKNFRETVQSQLKNVWLLQSQCQWQQ
ncbi:uncharacterized protein LOC109810083 [Cajanus cajan]|uniref:DUF7804 domain-containing protein n=1 Tax=Cajanus cajan TaxID=3821 RepID=A0A151SG37_CAJCA|nr:uncharacterized protein LOC109810083 [Cajanus cajan]KYP53753.1 hypothetical protein KK1_024327 [Cajanus cajan]